MESPWVIVPIVCRVMSLCYFLCCCLIFASGLMNLEVAGIWLISVIVIAFTTFILWLKLEKVFSDTCTSFSMDCGLGICLIGGGYFPFSFMSWLDDRIFLYLNEEMGMNWVNSVYSCFWMLHIAMQVLSLLNFGYCKSKFRTRQFLNMHQSRYFWL